MNTIIPKIRIALLTSVLAFSGAHSAYADDIEIYRGITEAESAGSQNIKNNPNVMFILDTSGSMWRTEAIPVASSDSYDPDVTYGGNDRDEFYYVYDKQLNYTGVKVDKNQNHCQASKDFFDDPNTRDVPSYFDDVLFWQSKPEVTKEAESCDAVNVNEVEEYDVEVKKNGWKNLIEIDLSERTPDSEVTLEITLNVTNYKGKSRVRFFDSDGKRIDGEDTCIVKEHIYNRDYSCSITSDDIPDNAKSFKVRFKSEGKRFEEQKDKKLNTLEAVITLEKKGSVAGDCPDEVVEQAEGDWADERDSSQAYVVNAIECAADFGKHGNPNSSPTSQPYPRRQGNSSDDLTTPKYTSERNGTNTVVWASNIDRNKYIYPGNYHQFLSLDPEERVKANLGPDEIVYEKDDASTYCLDGPNNGSKRGHYVKDIEGNYFECVSRIDTLKKSMKNILSTMKDTNVGLMRLNPFDGSYDYNNSKSSNGGSVIVAIDNINDKTHRDKILNVVSNLPADGYTPIQETLYTAHQYYVGGKVINKNSKVTTDSNAIDGDNFKSPINQCQDNSIILLSDGVATMDTGHASEINELNKNVDGAPADCSGDSNVYSQNGQCLDNLAYNMANVDQITNIDSDTNKDETGNNYIYTYTVAFGSDLANSDSNSANSAQLVSTSNAGARPNNVQQHFNATDSSQLTDAFNTILLNLDTVTSDSFVSPAVAVNAFNRLQFRDDLYFALFRPEVRYRWNGNVKKFKVTPDGTIVGRDNIDAIGEDGFFTDTAKSFWQPKTSNGALIDEADGHIVTKGGVANQLDINLRKRKFYINLDSATADVELLNETNFASRIVTALGGDLLTNLGNGGLLGNVDTIPAGLIATGNNILPNVGQINKPDLSENTDNIIKWTLGADVDQEQGDDATDPNYFLGESLHGTPFVADFGTANAPDDVLFFTTNQGLLHAIDGSSGQERWTFMPDIDLLPNLGAYYNNQIADDHKYGLDGEITFSVERDANTGKVSEALMFLGQRRGGKKYFALDVTNATFEDNTKAPVSSLWTLDNLPRMAQSWARPVAAKVNYCSSTTASSCAVTDVLFISGGYDPQYDDLVNTNNGNGNGNGDAVLEPRSLSSLSGNVDGNAIYMVDQNTGALLWMAGQSMAQVDTTVAYLTNSEMTHSFPSEPTPVDADFDGVIDFMYAVDIAGRVWRFDFSGDVEVSTPAAGSTQRPVVTVDENDIVVGNNNLTKETAGGIIATLSDESDNRRFYNRLDISLSARTKNDLAKFNIVTGSGFRAGPLTDEVQPNRLYFLYDRNIRFPKFTADANGKPSGITYNYAKGDNMISPADIPQKTKSNTLDTSPAVGSNPAGENYHGFYVELGLTSSEKMLNPTLTDDGIVLAVSYSPEEIINDQSDNLCKKSAGSSALYQIDLLTGDFETLTLNKSGISAKPVIIEVEVPNSGTSTGGGSTGDPSGTGVIPPLTNKILIIGSEAFDGSGVKPRGTQPPSPGEPECDPRLPKCLNAPNTGDVEKVNWWERRQ